MLLIAGYLHDLGKNAISHDIWKSHPGSMRMNSMKYVPTPIILIIAGAVNTVKNHQHWHLFIMKTERYWLSFPYSWGEFTFRISYYGGC
jgi:hypothetical protein